MSKWCDCDCCKFFFSCDWPEKIYDDGCECGVPKNEDEVVEQMGALFDYTTTIGYVLVPHDESVSKTAFENIDALIAYLERTKEVVGSFRDGFTIEPCEFVKVVE